MNNLQNQQLNSGESGKENTPPIPEINPQQPFKDIPEVQQPSKELPDKGKPDEVETPSKMPNIKEPKQNNG